MLSTRIKYLTGSESRIKILAELNKNAKAPRDIVDILNVSRSTVQRCLSKFVEFGWIDKSNGKYCTTTGGSNILQKYYKLKRGDETTQLFGELYKTTSSDLVHLEFNENSKNNSTYIEADRVRPHRASRYCTNQINSVEFTNVKAIVPVIDSVLYSLFDNLEDEDNSAVVILEDKLKEDVLRYLNDKHQNLSENPEIDFLSLKSDFEYGMILYRQRVLINTYDEANNLSSCLMCPDPDVVSQAQSIFEDYLERDECVSK